MCINENWRPAPEVENNRKPYCGEVCEVVETHKRHDMDWYILAGFNPHQGFLAVNFAILPDQTADEMQELEKEAIIK